MSATHSQNVIMIVILDTAVRLTAADSLLRCAEHLTARLANMVV